MKHKIILAALLVAFTGFAASVNPQVTKFEITPSDPEPSDSVMVNTRVDTQRSEDGTRPSVMFIRLKVDGERVETQNCGGARDQTDYSCSATFYHSFEQGSHDVTIYTKDTDFQTASRTQSLQVGKDKNQAPIAGFSYDPSNPEEGDSIMFSSSSYDTDGSIKSTKWDFTNDGTYDETGSTVYHSYGSSGEKTVKLKVTDNEGKSSTLTKKVDIDQKPENQRPVAGFSYEPLNPETDQSILFQSTSYDTDGSINEVKWDFNNDGDYVKTGSTVYHSFSTSGQKTVTLKVIDNDGAVSTKQKNIDVQKAEEPEPEPELEPRFDWTPKGPEEGEKVTFDASESKGDIVDYDWDFGDGFTASGKTTHHTYDRDNSYTVELTVSNADGSSKSIKHTVNVWDDHEENGGGDDDEDNDDQNDGNRDPNADFDWSPHSPDSGDSVHFDADDSYDSDGYITDYDWDFGDGSTSSGISPTHTFDSPGSYPVELNIEDNDGEEDSTVKYVHVGGDHTGDQCGITKDSMSFRLDDYSIYEGESTDAVLNIHNNADSNQDLEIKFKVNQDVIETRDITVSGDDSRQVRESVSPEQDSFIRAVVSTEGEPCDRKEFSFYKELVVYMDGGDTDEGSLDVEVTDEDNDPIEDARVEVDGPEDRVRYSDNEGQTGFALEEGSYDVEVSHPDYETEEKTVHIDEGESEELEFELEEDEDGEGDLQITVKDGEDDWIEDARVEVDGLEDETEYTDEYGFAGFELEEGTYDVEVSHPDYATEAEETVYVDDDETTSRTLRLYEEENEGIQIADTEYPSSVCRGSTLSVNVDVRNNAEIDEYVTVTGEGLGSINILDEFTVEEDEQETRTIRFTNVQGSGSEEFRIVAKNGTTDTVSRTVDVQSCDIATPDRDARSVSMKLSYPLAPNKAMVGDTVKVSGFVDGVYGRSEVRVNVDGETKARVSTQPDGYYQTFIRVDSPGMKTVTARSAGESASREIEVLPTATVTSVTAPRKVFEGETFEVCSEINSQIQAGTFLYEDGKLLKKINTNGQNCFEVTAQQPGTHIYKVRAATPGVSSSGTVSVEVLETDVEVKSFPGQIASVESASGMVKVDLYNTHDEEKRYQLQLDGIPSDWISQSRKEVVLTQGERKMVYFYLTPQEEGTYYPQITVDADNQEIYRQEIDLETGGSVRKKTQSFWSRLREAFSL